MENNYIIEIKVADVNCEGIYYYNSIVESSNKELVEFYIEIIKRLENKEVDDYVE